MTLKLNVHGLNIMIVMIMALPIITSDSDDDNDDDVGSVATNHRLFLYSGAIILNNCMGSFIEEPLMSN